MTTSLFASKLTSFAAIALANLLAAVAVQAAPITVASANAAAEPATAVLLFLGGLCFLGAMLRQRNRARQVVRIKLRRTRSPGRNPS